MITLNAGATNSVVLRLNDNVTISNPIYLFELESVQSREKFQFTAQDYSTNTRYNQFYIREISGITASISLTASTPQILLEYGGFYNYKVIQRTNYGLTYSETDVVLDKGKAVFYNGEYLNFFFFEINEDYVFDGYVLDDYVLGGNRDYIFDDFVSSKAFELDDILQNKVFDLSQESKGWDFEDEAEVEVFDPEFNDQALMTETDEYLITEDGIQIIY